MSKLLLLFTVAIVVCSPWEQYILVPESRTIKPVAVYKVQGIIEDPENILHDRPTTFLRPGSYLILDFGKEVGGIVSLHFADSHGRQQIGLSFSESTIYAGVNSDESNGGSGIDGAIYTDVDGPGLYTMPQSKLRGGFRYLTIYLNGNGYVTIDQVWLLFTASPNMKNLRDYPNYFYCNDPLLNRIWYAGAYTLQMNTIQSNQGRIWGPPKEGWENDATVGEGTSVIVDGAKRDRTVWPGDLGISAPTVFVSTNDMESLRNSIDTLFKMQKSSGELPFAGPQVNAFGSDTYHMWSLIGASHYYTYTSDIKWLRSIWIKFTLGVQFISNKMTDRGLVKVTGINDWARSGQGGENIEANAIFYKVLVEGKKLATQMGDGTLVGKYQNLATTVKEAVNKYLWDAKQRLYRDNPTSTLHPQDGNSAAVWFGLYDVPEKAKVISKALTKNWNTFGSTTPEKSGSIATFPGSMELHAHYEAQHADLALELIRRQWGYMLNHPTSTNSTFWEGYKADGTYDYRGTYMSHAHGWATGPTSALTFYSLGIQPRNGSNWSFIPQIGDLTSVEGQITISGGVVRAKWTYNGTVFKASLEAPVGSRGTVGVPCVGKRTISFNNHIMQASIVDDYFYLHDVLGGYHEITVL
jgi:hypothetical protein